MLTVYSLEQCEEWDAVVRSFQSYDVYYLSGYVKAFEIHGDGEPLLFYYQDESVRGINVVMKRDIAKDPHFEGKLQENTWFDFATPYGYGGWLLDGVGNPAPLFETYRTWCQKNKIISEFVRYHPILENHMYADSVYQIVPLGGTIAMDLSSPENIWKNLSSQNRSRIRKAKKNGVKVYHGRSKKLYETFREIYNSTMTKDYAANYYYFSSEFYESILRDLPHHAQVFYAQIDDTIIASYIILAANGNLHYHLGGSVQEYLHLAPNNLLMYKVALWGSAIGCTKLHLGGGVGARDDSLYRFKKTFYRGEPCQYYIGKKIFLPERYEELVSLRTDLPESDFFPYYRA